MPTISPEQALELPVGELALMILADLVTVGEWNEYNYGNRHRQDVEGGYSGNAPALRAIGEAMDWLRAHDLIPRKIDDADPNTIFVTRWGTPR